MSFNKRDDDDRSNSRTSFDESREYLRSPAPALAKGSRLNEAAWSPASGGRDLL